MIDFGDSPLHSEDEKHPESLKSLWKKMSEEELFKNEVYCEMTSCVIRDLENLNLDGDVSRGKRIRLGKRKYLPGEKCKEEKELIEATKNLHIHDKVETAGEKKILSTPSLQTFLCKRCGHVFGLKKTLGLHQKNCSKK